MLIGCLCKNPLNSGSNLGVLFVRLVMVIILPLTLVCIISDESGLPCIPIITVSLSSIKILILFLL